MAAKRRSSGRWRRGSFSRCSVTGTPRTQAQPWGGAPVANRARLGSVAIYTHLDSSTTTASAGAAKGPLRRVRDDLWAQDLYGPCTPG